MFDPEMVFTVTVGPVSALNGSRTGLPHMGQTVDPSVKSTEQVWHLKKGVFVVEASGG